VYYRNCIPILVLAAALVVAGAAGGAPTGAAELAEARLSARISAADALERPLLALINQFRRQHGVPPLRLAPSLDRAADRHGRSMALHGYFSHDSLDGSSVRDRVSRTDRSLRYVGLVGEVLLWRSPAPTPVEALAMWLQSPPHRAVLIDARYRMIGLGAVSASAASGVYGGLDVTIVAADLTS
jgi:uncharacterized protein YkwD